MSSQMLFELLNATWETIYMVFISGGIAVLFGIPLGVILFITRKNNILASHYTHLSLGFAVNWVRSIPFIILLVAIIPFTRLIVGTSIGTTAAIVPLSISAIPFVARIVETALAEIASGLIEAGMAMGATPLQIIYKILIPEAMPGIISGVTLTLIALVGYSAMAGAIGGGGLGDLAIRYGYQRFDVRVMIETIIILLIMVQVIQYLGDKLVKQFSHK
jgi:D-methionine transport system permease protein